LHWNVRVPEIVSQGVKYHPKDKDNLLEEIHREAEIQEHFCFYFVC
tara:strand:+ start:5329 stop:5466 length:138 start_codon:yes stop_codon:yes gene_type:complete